MSEWSSQQTQNIRNCHSGNQSRPDQIDEMEKRSFRICQAVRLLSAWESLSQRYQLNIQSTILTNRGVRFDAQGEHEVRARTLVIHRRLAHMPDRNMYLRTQTHKTGMQNPDPDRHRGITNRSLLAR